MNSGDADQLAALRKGAFGIAYRMLGTVSEAEDVVQEALLRFHRALSAGEVIRSPRAFVATITTRLAISALKSARVRRERYVGVWLPEPLVTQGTGELAAPSEDVASLSLALLALLEALSPEQRAALLLHDVFDYDYAEIARIIDKSEAAVRQLAVRARRQLKQPVLRKSADPAHRAALARRFFAAAQQGDVAGLEALLSADVRLTGDGGGKAPAAGKPFVGPRAVAEAIVLWLKAAGRLGTISVRLTEINGGPGAIFEQTGGAVAGVLALEVAGERIVGIEAISNPDKLRHLGPVADIRVLARQSRSRLH